MAAWLQSVRETNEGAVITQQVYIILLPDVYFIGYYQKVSYREYIKSLQRRKKLYVPISK